MWVDIAHFHPKSPPGHDFWICQHTTHDPIAIKLRGDSTRDLHSMHTRFSCDLGSLKQGAGSVWPRKRQNIAETTIFSFILRLSINEQCHIAKGMP